MSTAKYTPYAAYGSLGVPSSALAKLINSINATGLNDQLVSPKCDGFSRRFQLVTGAGPEAYGISALTGTAAGSCTRPSLLLVSATGPKADPDFVERYSGECQVEQGDYLLECRDSTSDYAVFHYEPDQVLFEAFGNARALLTTTPNEPNDEDLVTKQTRTEPRSDAWLSCPPV